MIRKSLLVTVVGTAGLMVVTLNAGGWAVVTLDTLPDAIVVGKATPVGFMVRQHGVTPLPGLQPVVRAVLDKQVLKAEAEPTGKAGHYSATLTLPRPGDWVITVQTNFIDSQLTLLPLKAVAAGATVQPMSAVERGRGLFVAKGCASCHQNTVSIANRSTNIGPLLIPQKYQAEFLTRILADPAGTLPKKSQPGPEMPNLDLQPQEIASLVAFINSAQTTASR